MNINDLFSSGELENAIEEQLVRKQTNNNGLAIYNYTNKAQIFHIWNNVTTACRGLIVNESTGKIIARPWDKFFNYAEKDNVHLTFGDFVNYILMDKMDGSLGILYFSNGEFKIATRGSFESEQAIKATKMLHEKYPETMKFSDVVTDYTFMFEIIYPENQIVVNYGDREELVLLGARHIESGRVCNSEDAAALLDWKHSIAKVYEPHNLKAFLAENPFNNNEGYVILAEDGYMGKIKHQEYVDLHHVIFDFSAKSAWNLLSNGGEVDTSYMNDTRKAEVDLIINEVKNIHESVSSIAYRDYDEILSSLPADFTRKDFALMAKEASYPSALFTMLDSGDVETAIWNNVKRLL